MTPTLAELREALSAALLPVPDVAFYPVEPDATDLPAIWVTQPNAFRSPTAATMHTASWAIVLVVDETSAADVEDTRDDLIGVIVERVARAGPFRLDGWNRGTAEVGGRQLPAATVNYQTDHVTAC